LRMNSRRFTGSLWGTDPRGAGDCTVPRHCDDSTGRWRAAIAFRARLACRRAITWYPMELCRRIVARKSLDTMSWCSSRTQIRGGGDGRFIAMASHFLSDREAVSIRLNQTPKGPVRKRFGGSWLGSNENWVHNLVQSPYLRGMLTRPVPRSQATFRPGAAVLPMPSSRPSTCWSLTARTCCRCRWASARIAWRGCWLACGPGSPSTSTPTKTGPWCSCTPARWDWRGPSRNG
jgi:hypothetical protein